MAATSRRSSEATSKWSGRGGVVKKFLDHTTPSARTNEASRLFLIVQPPLLLPMRRGAWNPYPVLVCAQTLFATWIDVPGEGRYAPANSQISRVEQTSRQNPRLSDFADRMLQRMHFPSNGVQPVVIVGRKKLIAFRLQVMEPVLQI